MLLDYQKVTMFIYYYGLALYMEDSVDELLSRYDEAKSELQPFESRTLAEKILESANNLFDITKVYVAFMPRTKPDGEWDEFSDPYEKEILRRAANKLLLYAKTSFELIGIYWLAFNDSHLFPKLKNRLIVRAEDYPSLSTIYVFAKSTKDTEFAERVKKKIYRRASPEELEHFKTYENL